MNSAKSTGTVKELSAILDIGDRQIQKLKKRQLKNGNPIIISPARGQYDLLGSAAGYIAFLKENDESTDDSGQYKDPQKRLQAAKASMAEREDAIQAGTILKTDEVEQMLIAIISLLASHIDAIAGRLSSTISGISGHEKAEIYNLLRTETNDIRQTISDGLQDFINTQQSSQSNAPTSQQECVAVGREQ